MKKHKKKRKTISVRVSKDVYDALDELESSKSDYIRHLIWEDVEGSDTLLSDYLGLERALDESQTVMRILNTLKSYRQDIEDLTPQERVLKADQYLKVLRRQKQLVEDEDTLDIIDGKLKQIKHRKQSAQKRVGLGQDD